MSGSSPRPKGGAISQILRKFLSYFPSQHYLWTSFQCFLLPPTIHWAQHAAIGSVGLPNTTAEVGEFQQQRNIFTLIYSTLQTFGKRINAPCIYWALHTARARSRESHQHSSEHKWLITQPKRKLNRSFTRSASTAEESLATSPSATPSSSSTTNTKPASAEGLQLASFCHKPGLWLEQHLPVQWDSRILRTNAQLLATSFHTTPHYPLGRFLNSVQQLGKASSDYLSSRHSLYTSIQEAGSLAGTSQSLF